MKEHIRFRGENMTIRKTLGSFVITLSLLCAAQTASAKDPVSLLGYDVTFTPRIDFTGKVSDNIRSETVAVHDTVTTMTLNGELRFRKPDRTITSDFGVNLTKNFQLQSEESNDFYVSAGFRQEFSDGISLNGFTRFDDTVQDRKIIAAEHGDSRTDMKTLNTHLTATYRKDKTELSVTLEHARMDLANIQKLGTIINKNDEDRNDFNIILSGRHTLDEFFTPSFTISAGKIKYDQKQDDFGHERSSDVTKLLLGGQLNFGSHLTLQGETGYYLRNYEGVSFKSISMIIGDARLQFTVNDKLNGSLSYSRSFQELNVAFSPGLVVDIYSGGINYNPTEALMLMGQVSKMISLMDIVGTTANDYVTTLGLTYRYNKRYSGMMQYTNTRRFSSNPVAVPEFMENAVMLKVSLTF